MDENITDDLCDFQQGEDRGADLLRQLATFAPTIELKQQVLLQVKDEEKHHRLFSTRLKDLNIDCLGMDGNLESLYDLAQEYVNQKDWVGAITCQAVIEELAMASFIHAYPNLDPQSQLILQEIIADERRHLAFGIEQLKTFAAQKKNKDVREVHAKIRELAKGALNDKQQTEEAREQTKQILLNAYKMHKARLHDLGIELNFFQALF